jgi:hypothetical protein
VHLVALICKGLTVYGVNSEYLPLVGMLTVLCIGLWTLPAHATQLGVAGSASDPSCAHIGCQNESYSLIVSPGEPSLSGSVSVGGSIAHSSSNLVTGQLKAFHHSSSTGNGYAGAQIWETIHIVGDIVGGSLSGTLTMELDGILTPNPAVESLYPNPPTAWATFQLSVNGQNGGSLNMSFRHEDVRLVGLSVVGQIHSPA